MENPNSTIIRPMRYGLEPMIISIKPIPKHTKPMTSGIEPITDHPKPIMTINKPMTMPVKPITDLSIRLIISLKALVQIGYLRKGWENVEN